MSKWRDRRSRGHVQLFFRLPFPRQFLCFGNLLARQSFGDEVAVLYRVFVSLSRREVDPHVRQYVVLRYALTFVVHVAEGVLRFSISLLSERIKFLKRGVVIALIVRSETIVKVGPRHRHERNDV